MDPDRGDRFSLQLEREVIFFLTVSDVVIAVLRIAWLLLLFMFRLRLRLRLRNCWNNDAISLSFIMNSIDDRVSNTFISEFKIRQVLRHELS